MPFRTLFLLTLAACNAGLPADGWDLEPLGDDADTADAPEGTPASSGAGADPSDDASAGGGQVADTDADPGAAASDSDAAFNEGDTGREGLGDGSPSASTPSAPVPDVCGNGLDDDGDGQIDEEGRVIRYVDADADGFGTTPVLVCPEAVGTAALAGDCDDQDAGTFPGAFEVYYDGRDQACDGGDDFDADGDGHDAPYDCLDADPSVFPGAVEVHYDGVDGNCLIDDEWDADRDGHTVVGAPVGDGADCDDMDARAGVPFLAWRDADGDGFGDPASETSRCDLPAGWLTQAGDCDDAALGVAPGRTEVCDGRDQNCDGIVDEGVGAPFWPDADADGRGDGVASVVVACAAPAGHVANGDDCDDADDATYLGAPEQCDALDNDCLPATTADGAAACGAGAWWSDGVSMFLKTDRDRAWADARGNCEDHGYRMFVPADDVQSFNVRAALGLSMSSFWIGVREYNSATRRAWAFDDASWEPAFGFTDLLCAIYDVSCSTVPASLWIPAWDEAIAVAPVTHDWTPTYATTRLPAVCEAPLP